VKRAEAESIVDSQFPDKDPVRRENIVRIMCGSKLTKSRREGARQKIGGKYVRVTAQVLPSHVGKRQRIFNSGSKSARMWRESEAIIRGETTLVEGRKMDKILWEEKYHKYFMAHIQRYRDNDPNYKPSRSPDPFKKGGKK
jgi:hypothetical protein